MPEEAKKKSILARTVRIILKTLAGIVLFLLLVMGLILLPPVQTFIVKKAAGYLEDKIHTPVSIEKLYIGFPRTVVLEKIYLQGQSTDTLLYAGSVKVNIGLINLITGKSITVDRVELNQLTAKVNRVLPDTSFNFQYIIDAFATNPKEPVEKENSSAMPIRLGSIEFNDIRVLYKDDVAGYDAALHLGHFDTDVRKFDLEKMEFAIGPLQLENVNARLHQVAPLPIVKNTTQLEDIADTTSIVPQIELGPIRLRNIQADYKSEEQALSAILDLGDLLLKTNKIDLTTNRFEIETLDIDRTTARITINSQPSPKQDNQNEKDTSSSSGLHLYAKNLSLRNSQLQFDDLNAKPQATGMDYMHLQADSVNLDLKEFVFSSDSIAGHVTNASLQEKSGFNLEALRAQFIYTGKGATLNDFYIKTAGSEIKRKLIISYPSIEAVQKDPNLAAFDIDLDRSRIHVKDILSFVPSLKDIPAFTNPNAYLDINSKIKGSVANLQIQQMQLAALGDTKLDIQGSLKGLPDINRLDANLLIKNISTSKNDVLLLAPVGSIPDNIEVPERLQLAGSVKGTAGQLNSKLNLNTSMGNLSFEGLLHHITDTNRAQYDIALLPDALQLGRLLKDTANLGPVTARLKAKGSGLDLQKMDVQFSAKIISAVLKHYDYKDVTLEGNIAQQQAAINAAIADPNIRIQLDVKADLAQQYPAAQLQLNIDSIKTRELHLTADNIIYRGKIDADFQSTNPDSLAGKLFILQSLLVHNQNRIQLDTLRLLAEAMDSTRRLAIHSDFLTATLNGQYRLTEMGNLIQNTIQPYYNLRDTVTSSAESNHNFRFDASMVPTAALRDFLPDMKRLDSVVLRSHFSSDSGMALNLSVPALQYQSNVVNGFWLRARTEEDQLRAHIHIDNAAMGESLRLNHTDINSSIADNKINLVLRVNDREDKLQYLVKSLIEQSQPSIYRFSLVPDSLMLNYDNWTVAAGNSIQMQDNNLTIRQLNLSKDQQQLNINSDSSTQNTPLRINFNDFKIATITSFIQPDSSLVDGVINGDIAIQDITHQPVFTGDLAITDLSFKKDSIGNVKVQINNQQQNTYAATVTIDGKGNDVVLNANYYTHTSSFDAQLDIHKLPMTTVQAVSAGALKESSGTLNGQFDISGTIDNPDVNGELNFDNTAFNLAMLNSYFRVDQEKLVIDNQGIRFNRFQIKDSANNQLTIDGTAATENFRNYELDMAVRANNFRALNSTATDNQLFYGRLYFDTNLKIKGTETSPIVDGRLKINDKTDVTIVMPQNEPGVVDREGVVIFVDKDFPPPVDSLFLKKYDSLNNTSMQGMNISVAVETDKNAAFKLIVDQGSGDALDIKGGAQLTAGVEPGGKISLAGVYEIEDGGYNLSFNLLKRNFKIQKGSKITWEGEPTDATVAITAKYTANTSPLDLVKNQLSNDISASERNTYLQKLPFDVILKMEGDLLQPKISFDIVLPEGGANVSTAIINDVNTKLAMLRQDEAEMNKQVFALLLLNRFVAENPFSSSNSTSTSTLLMQSVNKFMTEQLNQWANDLIKGIDINFDLESTDDFSTGERQSRTDLNVGLSKRLLNDRLSVTVGSNFELDGPQQSNNNRQQGSNIAGNITVDYKLTEDGRYMLRGYRKNNYQGVIEGYIVETGVGFVITMDYNRFREIFQKKKARRQIREYRRMERNNQPPKTDSTKNG